MWILQCVCVSVCVLWNLKATKLWKDILVWSSRTQPFPATLQATGRSVLTLESAFFTPRPMCHSSCKTVSCPRLFTSPCTCCCCSSGSREDTSARCADVISSVTRTIASAWGKSQRWNFRIKKLTQRLMVCNQCSSRCWRAHPAQMH